MDSCSSRLFCDHIMAIIFKKYTWGCLYVFMYMSMVDRGVKNQLNMYNALRPNKLPYYQIREKTERSREWEEQQSVEREQQNMASRSRSTMRSVCSG